MTAGEWREVGADVQGGRAPKREPELQHVPALDGIRAVAVLAVMAFHNGFSWIPGGYYSLDAFFVLSGYLITSLLLAEWRGSGTVVLTKFWARRARRLLPAMFVLVAAVTLVNAVWPALFGVSLVGPDLATIFYGANWYYALGHVSYFAPPSSPLLHTWSLAIEEQFYLLWPLVVLLVLNGRIRKRREVTAPSPRTARLKLLAWVTVTGAVGSALWMALATPAYGDPTLSYYGTGTRAQALLIGAALAALLALRPLGPSARVRSTTGSVGVLGALGTLFMWWRVPSTSAFAFHGGFFVVSLASAAVIVGIVGSPRSPVARFLGLRPLQSLGRISYGVYLWYWPVWLVLSEQRAGLHGWTLYVLRVVVTTTLASLSAHFVEQPIRERRVRLARPRFALPAASAVAGFSVLLASVTAVGASQFAAADALSALHVSAATAGTGAQTEAGGTSNANAPQPSYDSATGRAPMKVLLVGDSVAGTLGVGLSAAARSYGMQIMNEGHPGCSVSLEGLTKTLWYTLPPGPPCRSGDPSALLDYWRAIVSSYNPDVVVYVARSDILDQQVGGNWEDVTSATFDTYLALRLGQAVNVLGSRGAAVVLLTSPFYETMESDATPWPEDQPTRVHIDNSVIREVAASMGAAVRSTSSSRAGLTNRVLPGPSSVTMFDLGSLVSPDGGFSATVDNTVVRCNDGIHFTAAGGELVGSRLLPVIEKLGKQHETLSPGGQWPGSPPPATPAWFSKLPCSV
jgi:peptidoglycan/LPS O-acetylase OafA/YrhL